MHCLKPLKILLFGKNAQLGWELQRSLAPLGELIALGKHDQQFCGNFNDLQGIAQTIRKLAPDIIVNAAAYTAVDKAESEPELAHSINGLAPGILAKEAELIGAWLVHYSTDYVFNGCGNRPWVETDLTAPLSVYGQTKLDGEQAIRATGCNHLIFRTSWVYGAHGSNFPLTILKLAQERDQLNVINDQVGAPTGADLLADVTAHSIRTALKNTTVSGSYHLVAAGETSWFEYANFVIEFARKAGIKIKVTPEMILPVPSCDFYAAAKRPLNSRLNTDKIQQKFGLHLPHWQAGVTRMMTEILEKSQ